MERPSSQVYGSIETTLAENATAGQEAGKMEFKVAEFDGTTSTVGLLIDGDTDANGEIDVTIGLERLQLHNSWYTQQWVVQQL